MPDTMIANAVEVKNFPEIEMPQHCLAYGGSQKWFRTPWARLAGCASVSAANLAAYYGIGAEPDTKLADGTPVYARHHYVQIQKDLYGYMTPGRNGFPDYEKYQEQFLRFAGDRGVALRTEALSGWSDGAEAFHFVRETVDAGAPLALLILGHTAKEIDDDTWHWMTVTGYDAAGARILISNYGKRQWMDAKVVFRPGEENEVTLIRFRDAA